MAFPDDYTYLGKLKIDWPDSSDTAAVTNLPILIRTSNMPEWLKSHLKYNTDNGGGDVRCVLPGTTTLLGLHIQKWDTTGSLLDAVAWTVMPNDINKNGSGATRYVEIWGNNPGDSQPAADAAGGVEAVYTAFTAVWMGDQDSGDEPDVTGGGHTADAQNGPTSDSNAEVYKRREFTSVDAERFQILGGEGFWDLAGGDELYISSWSEAKGFGAHNPIFGKTDGGQNERGWLLRFVTTNGGCLNFVYEATSGTQRNVDGSTTLNAEQRYHTSCRVLLPDGTNYEDVRIYVDAVQDGVSTAYNNDIKQNGERPYIAYDEDASDQDRQLNGFLEIVRVILYDRKSVAWVEAEFDLIRNDSSYISYESQDISLNGIVSSESFGSPVLHMQIDSPTGITSAEYVTPPNSIDMVFLPNGIISQEAFGSPDVGHQYIEPNGIVSSEVVSEPSVIPEQFISGTGIASSESFGSAVLNLQISIIGVTTEEAIGVPDVIYPQWITAIGITSEEVVPGPDELATEVRPLGIVSKESFGLFIEIKVGTAYITPTGIVSVEAFGEPSVSTGNIFITSPWSITSEEALGSPELDLSIEIQGIPTSEVFGSINLTTGNTNVSPDSADSAEAFGEPTVIPSRFIQASGIRSAEDVSQPSIVPAGVGITIQGISTGEGIGEPAFVTGNTVIVPNSIGSSEGFGLLSIVPQVVSVHPTGIGSAESLGDPELTTGVVAVSPNSVVSAETFGVASIAAGSVSMTPSSINSLENFGSFSVSPGGVFTTPQGISSLEGLGNPGINLGLDVTSVSSAEAFGEPSLTTGGVLLSPQSIDSSEALGLLTLRHVLIITGAGGISGAESIGNPYVYVRELSNFQQQMEDDLEEVFFGNEPEFSEKYAALYTYRNGETFELRVIFDNNYIAIDPDTGASIQMSNPMIMCQTSKFRRRPEHGDKIQIRGVNYEVIEAKPDGTGVSEIILQNEKTV